MGAGGLVFGMPVVGALVVEGASRVDGLVVGVGW